MTGEETEAGGEVEHEVGTVQHVKQRCMSINLSLFPYAHEPLRLPTPLSSTHIYSAKWELFNHLVNILQEELVVMCILNTSSSSAEEDFIDLYVSFSMQASSFIQLQF